MKKIRNRRHEYLSRSKISNPVVPKDIECFKSSEETWELVIDESWYLVKKSNKSKKK